VFTPTGTPPLSSCYFRVLLPSSASVEVAGCKDRVDLLMGKIFREACGEEAVLDSILRRTCQFPCSHSGPQGNITCMVL
jgi:hypothetical protein